MSDACPEIRSEAVDAIGKLNYSDAQVTSALVELIRDGSSGVRIAAATCAHRLVPNDQRVIDELALMLDSEAIDEIFVAAGALAQYGDRAGVHRRMLLPHVQTCLVRCDYEHAEQLLWAYAAICSTSVDEIRDYFEVRDEELCATALALLQKLLDRRGYDEKSKV